MEEKKKTREHILLPAETKVELKARWETHRQAFETVMEKLDDPENPDNLALTQEAQIHLSAMLKVQARIDGMCKGNRVKSREKGKGESVGKSEGDVLK
ncbi:hypothetical protein N0V84_001491 [Fusarium piperis]|uniref:Uncharacterized protein n=1 Tax=Fusarium piperis TaxID=1435070 RepID=A0A9W8WLH6_9HYPO|nr:hypothetical protein N0V84_001491 [Fusarium piperis]